MARHAARKWIDKLERHPKPPESCVIAVERDRGARDGASPVSVRVELRLKGDGRVVTARHGEEGEPNEQVGPAVDQAFRRLGALVAAPTRALPAAVGCHEGTGEIVSLRSTGAGVLEDSTGRRVSFGPSAVRDAGRQRLAIGTRVHFVEAPDADPRATLVRPIEGASVPVASLEQGVLADAEHRTSASPSQA